VPFKKKPEVKVEEAPDPKGAPGKTLSDPGAAGMGMQAASGVGKQGVLLDRYLEVTGELRKVPINLVLIVDPDHIAKVEKAFAESPLRFLTTQMMWQRCAVSLRPQEAGTGSTPVGEKGPAGLGFGTKGMRSGPGGIGLSGMRSGPGGFGSGLDGPIGPGRPPADSADGGDEQENLELTIYGVITLYDRPGRPPEQPK
jgi:hypothetical protein